MRQQMDSVYEALREGADFATLARRYSDDEACKMWEECCRGCL